MVTFERLDPDGPTLACTWMRSRKYGPAWRTDSRRCPRPATWQAYDDEHGWWLCDEHAEQMDPRS